MLLIQFLNQGKRMLGVLGDARHEIYKIDKFTTLYQLAIQSITQEKSLQDLILPNVSDETYNYERLVNEKKVLPPIDHPDPLHCFITGTGLTHINSRLLRKNINSKKNLSSEAEKIYQDGFLNGKPMHGKIGSRPEWFYKGNGLSLRSTAQELELPEYGLNCGEEAELVAIYVNSPLNGDPFRLGFAIGNELSDHALEQKNHYYLAQSKLLPCAIGPEIFIGNLPQEINGNVKITRNKQLIWDETILTGANSMTHSIANIEHYLFQNKLFRHPGNVHYHFLGADKLSFSTGIELKSNDLIEISMDGFYKPLLNFIQISKKEKYHFVKNL